MRRAAARAAVIRGVVVLAAAATVAGCAGGPTARMRVLAPADGSLHVGVQVLGQLVGQCTHGQCQFASRAALPTVRATPGTLPLTSAKSKVFTVSSFDVAKPTAATGISGGPGRLYFERTRPGRYEVTVRGSAGGMWQFLLDVTGPPASPTPTPVPPRRRHPAPRPAPSRSR